MIPKAVIFDVDGTLIDSNDLHTEAWMETFRKFRLEVRAKDVRGRMGMGSDQLLSALFKPGQLGHSADEIASYRSKLFSRSYQPKCCAFPQVRSLFERIKAAGPRIALASSATRNEVETNAKLARVEDLLDISVSADDAERTKPAPDIFAAALEKLELSSQEAVVVGDTPYDAQAAKKIGLPMIGLLCGGFPRQDLSDAGCMAIYKDPEDLLRHYETSPLGGA
jgi:phosphoglycolate phosphatase-like HAD superfamily hydrolase